MVAYWDFGYGPTPEVSELTPEEKEVYRAMVQEVVERILKWQREHSVVRQILQSGRKPKINSGLII